MVVASLSLWWRVGGASWVKQMDELKNGHVYKEGREGGREGGRGGGAMAKFTLTYHQDVLLWAVLSCDGACWWGCPCLDWPLPAVREWLVVVLDEASFCLWFICWSLASWMCFLAGSWLGSNSSALLNSWMATSKSPSLARTTPKINKKNLF